MSLDLCLRTSEKVIPPRLPQDVIDEIIERPRVVVQPLDYFTLEEALKLYGKHGKIFGYMDMVAALKEAKKFAGENGFVATLPYIFAAMASGYENDTEHSFSTLSEEAFGKDNNGIFGKKGEELLVVLHGEYFMTQENIRKNAALNPFRGMNWYLTISESEFDDLLKGKLPNGESVELYTPEEVVRGKVLTPFGRYGVVVRFDTISPHLTEQSRDVDLNLAQFQENPLVLARAGTPEYLELMFNRVTQMSRRFIIRCGFMSLNLRRAEAPNCFGVAISLNTELMSNFSDMAWGHYVAVNPSLEEQK